MLDTAFVGNRAVHISIDRMANLPNRVTGVVPAPQFGSYRYYDGSDASWYDSWQTSLSKNFSHGLNFGVSHTWAHNLSYGDADLQLVTVPQDFNNIRADKGPTTYDIRQSFKGSFLYAPQACNGPAGKVARRNCWQTVGRYRGLSSRRRACRRT